MQKHIYQLIEQGEGQQLDFKYCVNDARKIARSLAAFANSDGGTLLLGVKDNGKISGVKSEEEFYMIEKAAQLYCRPEIPFECRSVICEGKTVFEVIVFKKSVIPYYALDDDNVWKVFIRRRDQNLPANRILLECWKHSKTKRDISIVFDKNIEMLFNYLNKNEFITLETYTQLTNTGKYRTENILINLIVMDLIEMDITEKETIFTLKNNLNKAPKINNIK
jgi:predicted HTH transcriptional regulator